MIIDENHRDIGEPLDPQEVEIFNTAYRLFLDGAYAADEATESRAADGLLQYYLQLEEYQRFCLTINLCMRLHALDLANHLMTSDPQAEGDQWPDTVPETP